MAEELTKGLISQKADHETALLRTERLTKAFGSGPSRVVPLNEIDLSIEAGEMVAVVGPSGTGKSTLLHLLAALDTPSSGTVYFAGDSLQSLDESKLAAYRTSKVGFVWQRHHLMPDFTAAENVAMPLLVRGVPKGEAIQNAKEGLVQVGLTDRATHRASELSGGEQQRVAIARALANRPEVLLADEPTGDLDEKNAEVVFDLLRQLQRSHHLTCVVATHNLSLAQRADRMLVLEHGKLSLAEDGFVDQVRSASTTKPGAKPQESMVTRV